MALAKNVYRELESAVGSHNVSENIGVLQSYSKQPFPPGFLGRKKPDAVVLPESVRDVQAVIKLANRYKFAYIPTGNYNWDVPRQDNTVIIDFKKMNKIIEIDEKMSIEEVKTTLDIIDSVELKSDNESTLIKVADKIADVAQKFSKGRDGTKLGAIDVLVPGKEQYKGKVYDPKKGG